MAYPYELVFFDRCWWAAGLSVLGRSQASRALLAYLIEEAEAGRGALVNEYTIAQDVVGKGEDFDPQADPIVRVRMRRLREAIERHYEAHGAHGAQGARLEVPRGGYELVLSPAQSAAQPEAQSGAPSTPSHGAPHRFWAGRKGLWGGAIALLCLGVAALFLTVLRGPEAEKFMPPLIEVAPFANLTQVPENSVYETGFQRQIALDLHRFGRFRVTTGEAGGAAPDFRITGTLLSMDDPVEITLLLEDVTRGATLFQERIAIARGDQAYFEAMQRISRLVSGKIGAQGGTLSAAQLRFVEQNLGVASTGAGASFRCVVLVDAFLVSYAPEAFLAAHRCFERLEGDMSDVPVVGAAWGTLRMHAVPELRFMDVSALPAALHEGREEVLAYAEALAARLPQSDNALILLGAMQNASGQLIEAQTSFRPAIEVNPANPIALALMSYVQMAADDHGAARVSAEQAILLSAEPAPFMYLPVVIAEIVDGDGAALNALLDAYSAQSGPNVETISFIAAVMRGDQGAAARLRDKLVARADPLDGLWVLVQGPKGAGGAGILDG